MLTSVAVAAALALLVTALVVNTARRGESTVSTAIDDSPRKQPATSTTAAMAIGDDDLPTETTAAPPAVPTTAAIAAPATTAPATAPPSPTGPRTQVAVDPANRWTLYFHETSRCVELVVGERSYPNLLCRAAPATAADVVGDVITVDTPVGRVLVGMGDPRVTTFSSFPREGGSFFHDGVAGAVASSPSVRLVAGLIARSWSDVIVRGGPHHLARIVVSPENRALAANEVERVVGLPYGEWNGYRKLTSTGYYMGGDQELGLYTGSRDGPCLLYRRFAGRSEGVIADGCLETSGGHLQLATMEDVSGPYMPGAFIVAAATDVVGQLAIHLPDGSTLANLQPYPDEQSALVAWAQNISHVTVPEGVTSVDFVLTSNGEELARHKVAVPGR